VEDTEVDQEWGANERVDILVLVGTLDLEPT
jgi:hypothetical protein